MEAITEFRKIGQTLKTHGLEGGIVVHVEGDFMEFFLASEFVFLDLNGSIVPFYVEDIQQDDPMIIFLEDISDPESAASIVPADILLPSGLVPVIQSVSELADFGWTEGFTVFGNEGEKVGEVIRVENYPRQTMAFVSRHGREVMLPLHEDLIMDVDKDAMSLTLDIPEGLLDLDA